MQEKNIIYKFISAKNKKYEDKHTKIGSYNTCLPSSASPVEGSQVEGHVRDWATTYWVDHIDVGRLMDYFSTESYLIW